MCLVDDDGIPAHGKLTDLLRDEGELLEGGDDNGHAGPKGLRQLRGVHIDLLYNTLLVLELVDGVLELLVQHHAVRDNDDGIKDPFVLVVVEAGEPVGQPGDGIRLPAPGGMLDEVVLAHALFTCVIHECADTIELMVPGEDHGFYLDLLLLHLEVYEPCQDIEETVPLKDLLPEVGRFVVPGVLGIAGAAV